MHYLPLSWIPCLTFLLFLSRTCPSTCLIFPCGFLSSPLMWLKLNLPSFPYQYVFLAELLLPLTEPLFDRPPSFNASETFKFFLLVFLLHVARNHIYQLILPKECLTNSSLFSFPVVKSYPRGPYNLLFCVYNNFLTDSPRIDSLYTPVQPGYCQQITPLKLCFDHVGSLLNNFQCLSTPSGIKFKPSNLVFRNLSQVGYNLPHQVYLLLCWCSPIIIPVLAQPRMVVLHFLPLSISFSSRHCWSTS